MARINRAPRWPTIIVGILVTLIGVLGAFTPILPEKVGVWAFAVATLVMLAGIVVPGL